MSASPRLRIDVTGSGPDVVLLHGWAMHGGIFGPLTAALAPHARVHVVDLPGHGGSRGDAKFDLVDSAARIAAAVPRALWAGWSLGGLVALRAALQAPARVRGLALIATSPRFVATAGWPHGVGAHVFAEFANELARDYRHAIERFLALETLGSVRSQTCLRDLRQAVFARGEPDAAALRDGLAVLDETDLRADLGHLACPSLWIAGRRDRLVPPGAMQWSARQAPGGRYLEFNSGHAPFLEHAGAIAEALVAFLTELPA